MSSVTRDTLVRQCLAAAARRKAALERPCGAHVHARQQARGLLYHQEHGVCVLMAIPFLVSTVIISSICRTAVLDRCHTSNVMWGEVLLVVPPT